MLAKRPGNVDLANIVYKIDRSNIVWHILTYVKKPRLYVYKHHIDATSIGNIIRFHQLVVK